MTGGNKSGSNWVNAEPELGGALEKVRTANQAAADTFTEIWVAAGTYKPTRYAGTAMQVIESPYQVIPIPNRESDKAFVMISDVKIYGGFAGTESAVGQRDWIANPTILSGDVGEADDPSDNCNHVVIAQAIVW